VSVVRGSGVKILNFQHLHYQLKHFKQVFLI